MSVPVLCLKSQDVALGDRSVPPAVAGGSTIRIQITSNIAF